MSRGPSAPSWVVASTLALWAIALAAPTIVRAHALAPASLLLVERTDGPSGTLDVSFRTSRLRPEGTRLEPVLPRVCTVVPGSERETVQTDAVIASYRVRCGPGPMAGLANQAIAVRSLERTVENVLVELHTRDGGRAVALLHAGQTSIRFRPASMARAPAARGFLRLGFEHLMGGVDHVLFVLGLVFSVRRLRALLVLVTAFTLGHSVSLALSVLGVVRLPSSVVEIAIALSLLWLALRVLERPPGDGADASSIRRAFVVCAGFGLVHGLGFASAFAELGASRATLPTALLGFNVGVELGQCAIVLPAAGLLYLLRRRDLDRVVEGRIAWASAYVIGTASAYLVLVRAPDLIRAIAGALS